MSITVSIKNLSFALTALFLLGAMEPVFADSNIASQFPDMVAAPARESHVWAGSNGAQGNSPWLVETWTGGRRRVKRFRNTDYDNNQNANQYNNAAYNNPGSNGLATLPSGDSFPGSFYRAAVNYQGVGAGGKNSGNGGGGNSNGFGGYQPSQRSFDRAGSFGNGNFNNNANGNNLLDDSINMQQRKPDKFADNPQVDENGIRHFANGRHYDLKAMPIEQAVSISQASDDQIKEDQMMQKRMRQQRQRNRGNNNFF